MVYIYVMFLVLRFLSTLKLEAQSLLQMKASMLFKRLIISCCCYDISYKMDTCERQFITKLNALLVLFLRCVLFLMYMSVLPACIYGCTSHRGQKRISELLKLELQRAVTTMGLLRKEPRGSEEWTVLSTTEPSF